MNYCKKYIKNDELIEKQLIIGYNGYRQLKDVNPTKVDSSPSRMMTIICLLNKQPK